VARSRLPLASSARWQLSRPPKCGNTIGGPEPVNHASWPTDLLAFFHIQTADRLGTGVPKENDIARGRSRKATGALAPSLELVVKQLLDTDVGARDIEDIPGRISFATMSDPTPGS
jgi:hypothetical protein